MDIISSSPKAKSPLSVVISEKVAKSRVMVVEDEVFSQRFILSILNKAGFINVSSAKNGVEAIEMTHRTKPDLVILDLMMPELDGFGYLEHIRQEFPEPHIPVIVQTSAEDRDTKLRALSGGADDFLNKPLDPDELVLRARIQLERSFMLLDLKEICLCLQMEMSQSEVLLEKLEKVASQHPKIMEMLNQHYSNLASIITLPPLRIAS